MTPPLSLVSLHSHFHVKPNRWVVLCWGWGFDNVNIIAANTTTIASNISTHGTNIAAMATDISIMGANMTIIATTDLNKVSGMNITVCQ